MAQLSLNEPSGTAGSKMKPGQQMETVIPLFIGFAERPKVVTSSNHNSTYQQMHIDWAREDITQVIAGHPHLDKSSLISLRANKLPLTSRIQRWTPGQYSFMVEHWPTH